MQDLKDTINEKLTTEDYNNIPVCYCSRCLSLKIKTVGEDMDYCDDCGNTNITEAHIDEWERVYKERYGKNFLFD